MVQMGCLMAQMNALDEGNLTQISTCRSDACSLSKYMRYICGSKICPSVKVQRMDLENDGNGTFNGSNEGSR